MKRWLSLSGIALVILGFEFSTEAWSLVAARLLAGARAISAGADFQVSSGRYLAGVAAIVLGAVIWLVSSWLAAAERRVGTTGDRCPVCRAETQRVKRRWSDKLLSSLMGHRVTRRHCKECGWSGLSLRY